MELDTSQNKKMLFGLAKAYRKPKTGTVNIKDRNGKTLITPEEINEGWTDYFQELLNIIQEPEIEIDRGQAEDLADDLITEAELDDALKKMKNEKSPGCDGIVIELIKEGGGLLKQKNSQSFKYNMDKGGNTRRMGEDTNCTHL